MLSVLSPTREKKYCRKSSSRNGVLVIRSGAEFLCVMAPVMGGYPTPESRAVEPPSPWLQVV
jgi:hypothetical protein